MDVLSFYSQNGDLIWSVEGNPIKEIISDNVEKRVFEIYDDDGKYHSTKIIYGSGLLSLTIKGTLK